MGGIDWNPLDSPWVQQVVNSAPSTLSVDLHPDQSPYYQQVVGGAASSGTWYGTLGAGILSGFNAVANWIDPNGTSLSVAVNPSDVSGSGTAIPTSPTGTAAPTLQQKLAQTATNLQTSIAAHPGFLILVALAVLAFFFLRK